MTTSQIDTYLAGVDARIEAATKARVPSAWLCGERIDQTGASIPQFFAASPTDRAALLALGLEIAPMGLAMAARMKRAH